MSRFEEIKEFILWHEDLYARNVDITRLGGLMFLCQVYTIYKSKGKDTLFEELPVYGAWSPTYVSLHKSDNDLRRILHHSTDIECTLSNNTQRSIADILDMFSTKGQRDLVWSFYGKSGALKEVIEEDESYTLETLNSIGEYLFKNFINDKIETIHGYPSVDILDYRLTYLKSKCKSCLGLKYCPIPIKHLINIGDCPNYRQWMPCDNDEEIKEKMDLLIERYPNGV